MSATLDDFFGDSTNATLECLYCNKGEEVAPLVVAVSDAYGPTHWKHEQCEPPQKQAADLRPTWDEAMDEV